MVTYKRNLIQLGNKSLVMTIPWQFVESLNLRKGKTVFVKLADDGSTIKIDIDTPEDVD